MAPRTLDKDRHAPTTAVIQVADDGTATLYLGTELVEHALGVDRTVVMRVLADYAATLDISVRVTTQMPDGKWTRHRLEPNGTLIPLPRNLPPAQTGAAWASSRTESPRSDRPARWSRVRRKAASRGWLLAILVLLVAALMAVGAT